MYIESINLKNFRNYDLLSLNPSEKINILIGNNAQGKTNILEAIYFISNGRSFRALRNQELLKWEAEFSALNFTVFNFGRKISLEIRLTQSTKDFYINGVKKGKLSDLISNLKTVLFSPDDLNLIKGNPSERRRFIDLYITQLSPQYYHDLKQYEKVLYQRNTLLKSIREKKAFVEFLEVWDQQLLNYGSRIICRRLETLKKLGPLLKKIHYQITQQEFIDITYISNLELKSNYAVEDIRDKFQETLLKNQKEEVFRGVTLNGPHRDDLGFFIDNRSIQQYGSQGQQRTAVLSLKLAEMELINAEHGFYPVLLLDDVMSELDIARREYLLEFIKKKVQTFITTTNLHSFSEDILKECAVFNVEKGNATKF